MASKTRQKLHLPWKIKANIQNIEKKLYNLFENRNLKLF